MGLLSGPRMSVGSGPEHRSAIVCGGSRSDCSSSRHEAGCVLPYRAGTLGRRCEFGWLRVPVRRRGGHARRDPGRAPTRGRSAGARGALGERAADRHVPLRRWSRQHLPAGDDRGGASSLRYNAVLEVPDAADSQRLDAAEVAPDQLPDETLVYTLRVGSARPRSSPTTPGGCSVRVPGWRRVQTILRLGPRRGHLRISRHLAAGDRRGCVRHRAGVPGLAPTWP